MNDPSRWLGGDPPPDDMLARLLRAADAPAAGADVDWERLRTAIMRRADVRPARGLAAREWWDVVVQWRRLALAASVAAIISAAALLWRDPTAAELSLTDAAPESAALARVVAAYPDEAVLTSMLEDGRNDEFTSWDIQ